jgi:carboxyl-terminal processing protease
MKLFTFLLLLSTQCSAQTITAKQAKKLSGEIIKCIEQHSIFIDSLHVENIEQDFEQYIDTFNTYQEVGYYYTRQLRKAGDKHSFYISRNTLENYSKKQKDSLGFSYQLLEGNIGYLNIPGFLSTDNTVVNDFANQVHNAIRELDSGGNIKGWIVDLRNDHGGNMWPMVLGLSPLIGNEVPGYFSNRTGTVSGWKISSPSNGVTIENPYELKEPKNKIAVLYSKNTSSSGEMTAVCFIGKPNSRSFGEYTAGYTTANSVYYLSDDNIFVLAATYVLDRNKKKYTDTIMPDVLIENAVDANVMNQAKAWLKQ